MACRDCLEWLLKLLNLLLTMVGLAMVGYGIYLFVEYKSSSTQDLTTDVFIQLGRPMMMIMPVSLSSTVFDDITAAWFLCAFIGVGVLLFIISCCGCIGAACRIGCCLSCYSVFVFLLILIEVGCAAFIYFDSSWEDVIPTDDTGDFSVIYAFMKEHWSIVKWVALGIVILEVLVFLLALIVRAANRPADYDSDEEFINPRQGARQPLINPATGLPAPPGSLDQRPSRSDAWSARMREKYGLNTSEFTYNPEEASRFQPVSAQAEEERGCCTIM